ncbi:MAG: tetratricopeptide repeat protein [Azonexus sp.]|jgi:tetratricopeptide (TPR) repeat protein|nr:tetratricopeptide repeat protein [Azonexus sp.]
MAITTSPLAQPRFWQFKSLRAAAFGLIVSFAAPALADNLPEVQRLIKQGQYAQALEKVDAWLASRPKDAQGRFLKGVIYTEMNKPTEAIGMFTRLSEDYPELPEPYNNLAVLYAQQQQYDKARTALEMAIRTHPSYAVAYENLGDVYAKLASQAYDKALQLDGSNAGTQNKLSLIRDLISTSGKVNAKPAADAATTTATATPPVKVADARPTPVAPTANIVSTTPGAAAPETSVAPTTPPVKPVEPKPEPAPAVSNAANEAISRAIDAWADAWQKKNMKGYLAAYAPDFRPPNGASRKDWEADRTKRISGKSGKISVVIEDLQITVDGDSATAKFRQHYKAGSLNTSATKTMTLVRAGSRWLIKEENAR